jgi:hypothetical protein
VEEELCVEMVVGSLGGGAMARLRILHKHSLVQSLGTEEFYCKGCNFLEKQMYRAIIPLFGYYSRLESGPNALPWLHWHVNDNLKA